MSRRTCVYLAAAAIVVAALASPLYRTDSGRFSWLDALNSATRITVVTIDLLFLLPAALWLVRAKKGYRLNGRFLDTVVLAGVIVSFWFVLQQLLTQTLLGMEPPAGLTEGAAAVWSVSLLILTVSGFMFLTGALLKLVSAATAVIEMKGKWTLVASALLLPVVAMPSNFL